MIFTRAMNKKINYSFIITFTVLIGVWSLYSRLNSPIIAPSPFKVATSLISILLSEDFYIDLFITVIRGVAAFVISAVISLISGIMIGRYRIIENALYPFVIGLNGIPRISWILLAMIWLPFNSAIVIFIIVMTILPTMVMGIVDGYKEVPVQLLEMADIYKFSSISRIKNIFIPSMKPFILSSFRVASGLTWKSIIMAEFLTVNSGLGSAMGNARDILATDRVLAYTIIIILITHFNQSLLKSKKNSGK